MMYEVSSGTVSAVVLGENVEEIIIRLNALFGSDFQLLHQFSNVWTYRDDHSKAPLEIEVQESV